MSVVIRRAEPGDEAAIHDLLRGLAEFEKLLDIFKLSPEILARDLFGSAPVLVAALAWEGRVPVGVATWYWTYSTFRAARGLFIEDIYVIPEQRQHGLGRAFFHYLAAETREAGGCRMEWQVLDWNKKAIAFYQSLGGKPIDEWQTYRLEGEALDVLAR